MAERKTLRLRLFPELEHFAPADRRIAMRSVNTRLLRNWRTWVFSIVYILGIIALSLILLPLTRRLSISAGMSGGLIGGFLGGMLAAAVNLVFRRPIRVFLREDLVARGVPICIRCGYDLRGQTEPRCPECGAAFDPDLLTANRADKAQRAAND